MKYGLVLAGGGVRGACQVGVWKALLDMKIEISAIAGASIGAINGAIFAQGDFDMALKLWKGISADDIVAMPDSINNDDNLFDIKNFSDIAKEIYINEGLDMSPLERLLTSIINEDKLRKSPVDFGAAAFSLTQKKEIYKFKNEIPDGEIIDYLMASACMPGFRSRVIDNDKLIDGGVADNMPVGMLLGRGIRDIITVDVKGAGVYRDFNCAGRNVIRICCDEPQTGLMDFDREGIERSISEGYIKCMKAFGRYEGGIYAFETEDYRRARMRYSDEIIAGIEQAARVFGVDNTRLYTVDNLIKMTIDEYRRQKGERNEDGNIFEKIRGLDGKKVVMWLAGALEKGADDIMGEKLSVLGANYDAASAIVYFINQ
ncbi:MAG: patatin-like phospholipase family protein [Oscillospiraceae bacterium]|nr:patatin-like phospholipase family protein [Oscillospiraceae bacterium]